VKAFYGVVDGGDVVLNILPVIPTLGSNVVRPKECLLDACSCSLNATRRRGLLDDVHLDEVVDVWHLFGKGVE
jgi:hypothetical protein